MDFEFETTRTCLANAFAAAGAELLGYMDIVSTAVAPIPDTTPQKYAIAGTLPGILQMAGKMMGEEGGTGLEGLQRYGLVTWSANVCPTEAGDYVKFADVERLLAARAAAEKPTGDLTYEQIMENYRELGGETWGQSQQAVADAFRNHVGAIATDDAAGPYVKFRFRSMADADAALESIIASFSLPVSQEGAHAARNAVLEEAANALDLMNDSAGDRAAHEQREMLCCENERMWTLTHAAKAIRALQTPASEGEK